MLLSNYSKFYHLQGLPACKQPWNRLYSLLQWQQITGFQLSNIWTTAQHSSKNDEQQTT